jgi:hypothetical protein
MSGPRSNPAAASRAFLLGRSLAVWALIIGVESLHGILRRLFLEPLIGDMPARRVSVLAGSLLIVVVALVCSRWLAARSRWEQLLVGGLWVVLTVAFEIGLGRAFGYGWPRILSDYDLARGGLMPLGLLAMLFTPLAADFLRRKSGPTAADPRAKG